jgi:PKD domain-containing protein/FecR-like protein
MRCTVVLLFLVWSTIAWAQEAPSVRITHIDGNVVIRESSAQAWRTAAPGAVLERGDELATGHTSAALIVWSNGSMVKVYPDTEITLAGVNFDLETKTEKTILELKRGRLFVKAQVPDYLFVDFRVRMGVQEARTQGAEFAIERDTTGQRFTAWVLFGRVVSDLGTWAHVRIEEGRQGTIPASAKLKMDDLKPMDERIHQGLAKVSDELGGSVRPDEIYAPPGGKLVTKIGGARNRRGAAPFRLRFKALVAGGSGEIKSYRWEFGDGESASGDEAEHTFTNGIYTVILYVEGENGQKAAAQVGISAEHDCGC